jgi:GGDEF domain-containing protein
VSVGIGVYPGDGADAETLLKNADLALIRAKAQGRSNHQFFEPDRNVRAGAGAAQRNR